MARSVDASIANKRETFNAVSTNVKQLRRPSFSVTMFSPLDESFLNANQTREKYLDLLRVALCVVILWKKIGSLDCVCSGGRVEGTVDRSNIGEGSKSNLDGISGRVFNEETKKIRRSDIACQYVSKQYIYHYRYY